MQGKGEIINVNMLITVGSKIVKAFAEPECSLLEDQSRSQAISIVL